MADDGADARLSRRRTRPCRRCWRPSTPPCGATAWSAPPCGTGARPAETAEAAHRDLRDQVAELLDSRKVEPVPAKAGYALPFPIAVRARRREAGACAWRTASRGPGSGCWTRRRSGRTREAGRRRAGRRRAARRRLARGRRPDPGHQRLPRPPPPEPRPGTARCGTERSCSAQGAEEGSATLTATLLDCPPSTRTAKAMSPCGPPSW